MAPGDHILPDPGGFTHCRRTGQAAETEALGAGIAGLLGGGEIILLHGDLGAGKTCLVQGICRELAVAEEVVSPTFTLVNTYVGRLTVHHLDFYRVEAGHDLDDIGVPDLLDEIWDGGAVGLVEWPGPLVDRLGEAPRIELLGEVGAVSGQRRWFARGVPELPPAWTTLFPPLRINPC